MKKKLHRKRGNIHPWSPKLQQVYIEVQIWHAIKHQLKTGSNREQQKSSPKERLTTPIHIPLTTLGEAQVELTKARGKLKKIQTNAIEHREQHLQAQADTAEIEGRISAKHAIRQLLHIESTQRRYKE